MNTSVWNHKKVEKQTRLLKAKKYLDGKVVKSDDLTDFFEAVIRCGDKVVLEGNNQKQASYLSTTLAQVDVKQIHDLHIIIPSISRVEHLDLFEKGIAQKLDFSYCGTQSLRISQMIEDGILKIGSIHTYLELYSRLFVDLIPDICLVAADKADLSGNLYTGSNTEETPTLIEATGFKDGIVIVQVNEIVDHLERVDIPGDWVDVIVKSPEPYFIKPLFTRDPRNITELQVLIAMMCIKGIYAKHEVKTLNHGIGYNTAAIELLLPTYGENLGLKGKICTNWVLNPHPTLIPAIESGWVKSVCSFGGELGMENYVRARSDVFATGKDGSLRSNRAMAQLAGLYGIDLFIGSTLQMDGYGNSSTVTSGRLTGFGGAPNMGHNPGGRRHDSEAYLSLITSDNALARGRKLVVQAMETFNQGVSPIFVEHLDALDVANKAGLTSVPVMIYGDDVTHVVTEQGVAYLYKAENVEERKAALSAIAGVTPLGLSCERDTIDRLRNKGVVAYPKDLEISTTQASRNLLAAKNMEQLVKWSGGLYVPPKEFMSW